MVPSVVWAQAWPLPGQVKPACIAFAVELALTIPAMATKATSAAYNLVFIKKEFGWCLLIAGGASNVEKTRPGVKEGMLENNH